MDLKENANTLKVIRMTSEEKELMEGAKKIREYCKLSLSCHGCIFYFDGCCVLDIEDPLYWNLEKEKREDNEI